VPVVREAGIRRVRPADFSNSQYPNRPRSLACPTSPFAPETSPIARITRCLRTSAEVGPTKDQSLDFEHVLLCTVLVSHGVELVCRENPFQISFFPEINRVHKQTPSHMNKHVAGILVSGAHMSRSLLTLQCKISISEVNV
jgi:hypothetical protein